LQQARLALTDHFNRIDDHRAPEHAVFQLEADSLGLARDGRWRDLLLRWTNTTAMAEMTVEVDGKIVKHLAAQRAAPFGLNYLRIEFRGTADEGHVSVAELAVKLL